MGDTRTNIDWDPSHSTIGQTITGQSGSALKGGVNWNPLDSTPGALAQGNFSGAANQAIGGAQNLANFGKDLNAGLLAPAAGIGALYNSATGQPQAAKRRDQDVAGQTAENDARIFGEQQQQQQAQQQAAEQKAQQDKLSAYNLQQQGVADEDAFTKARNAAIKAKGQTLFGAWG